MSFTPPAPASSTPPAPARLTARWPGRAGGPPCRGGAAGVARGVCGAVARLAAVVLPAVALAGFAARHHAGHDYIEFHAAAGLVASGTNPYPFAAQAAAQREVWTRAGRPPRAPADPRRPSKDFVP